MAVIVPLEIEELHLQIRGRPEQHAVQTLAPNGADQPLNEGMGERHVRYCLDFADVQYAQIRLPLVKPIQRIMVRAAICRRRFALSRSIEHAAQPCAIHAAMHAKADDTTRAVIHHDEHPVAAQDGRFAAKQIETPQTVLV